MNATPCPHCGKPIRLTAAESTFTTYQTPGLWDRLTRPRAFQTTAAAPFLPESSTIPRPASGSASTHLEPGEKRALSHFRPLDPRADVATPALFAIVGGTLLTLTSFAITIAAEWPWYTPLIVWPVATTILYFATGWRVFHDRYLVSHEETMERKQPPPPAPPVQRPGYDVKGKIELGQKTLYTRFNITDARAWHRFCQAVHHHGKHFSQNEAKRHEVDPAEFNAILSQWADPDPQRALVHIESIGERLTPRLTRGGKAMIKLFALTPPPDQAGDN